MLPAGKVGIKLKQHLGAACEPVVGVGQRVSKGQVVGRPPSANGKPALGAPVHASIDGTVTAISDGVVWIERKTSIAGDCQSSSGEIEAIPPGMNRARCVMAIPKSIGAIELSSIGMGYQVEDEMLKAASVELLIARTICSGKYLIVIGGSVSDVEAADPGRPETAPARRSSTIW